MTDIHMIDSKNCMKLHMFWHPMLQVVTINRKGLLNTCESQERTVLRIFADRYSSPWEKVVIRNERERGEGGESDEKVFVSRCNCICISSAAHTSRCRLAYTTDAFPLRGLRQYWNRICDVAPRGSALRRHPSTPDWTRPSKTIHNNLIKSKKTNPKNPYGIYWPSVCWRK